MSSAKEQPRAVLFVTLPKALGGSNRSLITMMESLQGQTHRILAAPRKGPMREYAVSRNALDEFVPLPSGNSRIWRLAASLVLARWAVRNRRRVASIHAQALTGLNIVVPAAFLSRIPVVVRVSDALPSRWGRKLGPVVRRLIPELKVVPVSNVAAKVAAFSGVCDKDEAIVIPDPVDPNEVRAPEASRSKSDGVRIGFLGGTTDRKGWDVLLAAFNMTGDLDVQWMLFTNRPDSVDVGSLASTPATLHFMGRVRDVREAYAACDIVFVPSRAESFGRVVVEAMVNGLPVVASDIEPFQEILGEDAGIRFPMGDARAAADALTFYTCDQRARVDAGKAGIERAKRFDPSRIASQFAPLYGLKDGVDSVPWGA